MMLIWVTFIYYSIEFGLTWLYLWSPSSLWSLPAHSNSQWMTLGSGCLYSVYLVPRKEPVPKFIVWRETSLLSLQALSHFLCLSFYDILETPHLPKLPYMPRLKKMFLLRIENRILGNCKMTNYNTYLSSALGLTSTLQNVKYLQGEKMVRIFWLINIFF